MPVRERAPQVGGVTPRVSASLAVGALNGAISGVLLTSAAGLAVIPVRSPGDVFGASLYALFLLGPINIPVMIVVQAVLGALVPLLRRRRADTERSYAWAMALISLISGLAGSFFLGAFPPAGVVAAVIAATIGWLVARAAA